MVMDQVHSPTAQCVGQEFVRQYYTMLNEAPHYLHRFYSHNSSFSHGGDGKPGEEPPTVMGQEEIHRQILSFNFKRCHAKIRQVDCQPGVSNSVVVQVTGELSNNGEPMRRFMQTFVLTPQNPKKFYVHNDIFRYQDEVFYESDEEQEDPEVEMGGTELIQDGTISSAVLGYPGMETHLQQMSGQMVMPSPQPQQQPPQPLPTQQPDAAATIQSVIGGNHLGNGQASHQELESVGAAQPEPEVAAPEEAMMDADEQHFEDAVETQEVEPAEFVAPKQPSSWAGVLAGGGGGQRAPPPSALKPAQPAPAKPAVKPYEKFGTKEDYQPGGPKPPRDARPPRADRPEKDMPPRQGMEDFNRMSRYPDTQQLFVGNLPHNVSDQELKLFFEKYGKVIDLRISRKMNRDVPNFGFIVLEDAEMVAKILQNRPITFHGGHRLNVEEKKAKGEAMMRPSSGTRPGRGGMNGNGPMRGGPRGGRGGMRMDRGPSERGGRGGGMGYSRP